MLNRELIAFVQEPVMMILTVQSLDGRPTIGRGLGARASADGARLDLFFSRAQWPDLAAGCSAAAPIAATFCRPSTYLTYQVKGRVLESAGVDADDHRLARTYMRDTRAVLKGLGISDRQVDYWLTDRDLVRVGFAPDAVFTQTPGPDAGRILADA